MIYNDLAPWDYHALPAAPRLPGLVHGESHHARRARRRAGQGRCGRVGQLHRGRRRQAGLPARARHGPSTPRCPVREWLVPRATTQAQAAGRRVSSASTVIPHIIGWRDPMHGDPRVRQLLEELLDSERTPEEVCRHCPEFLPEVHRRWQRKRACDAELDALFLAPEPHSTFGSPWSMPSSAELPRIPGYEVLEVVGRGGMGVVYRARHVRLDRPVALKMLLTGAHACRESRERFLREARIGAGLRHPNIVQVYDMGDQDGLPYFTMEFVEGGNLAQKLAGMPQPPRET